MAQSVCAYLLVFTFKECLASSAESRTLDEWAPSLMESLIEYSVSDFSLPWFRSYNSKLIRVKYESTNQPLKEGSAVDVRDMR